MTFALICFVLSPKAQAVVPAPDGGYPGGNTAEGQNALFSLTSGGFNTYDTAIGFLWLGSNIIGSFNTAVGAGTLLANTADNNTATGAGSLLSNTIGFNSTASGAFALFSNTTGSGNTALGYYAGQSLTTGNYNINIGFGVSGPTGESGTIRIGDSNQSATYIGGIAGQTVGAGGTTCYVDNDGKLGVFLSARRFKADIADMGAASEALLDLRPVTFHYKPELGKAGIPQFGLVAEEVAEVNPDLVTHDGKGELSTVRYEAVNAMLLNEFLKEHRKNEKQEATIAELKTEIRSLSATLKEQAEQIQKVSAQIEMTKPVAQIVLNDNEASRP